MVRRAAGLAFAVVLVVAAAGLPTEPPGNVLVSGEGTVTVYGRPGSFGALDAALPSGQDVATVGLPGFAFPPGRHPHRLVKAGSTLLMAPRDLGVWDHPSSGDLFVAAFELGTKKLTTISIPTTAGKASVWRDGHAIAPSIADIVPVGDDMAVYTAWPTQIEQNPERDGDWPVLGLLLKENGQWKAGFKWTGGSLRAAGWDKACPPDKKRPDQSDCRGLGRMARLKSGEIVVTQQDGLAVIRVQRGLVELVAQYDFPAGAGKPWEVTAHPAEDRFVVGLKVQNGPSTVQEFQLQGGSVIPLSARLLPAEPKATGATPSSPRNDEPVKATGRAGYGASAYDASGNLWVARNNEVGAGPVAIFTKPRCAPAPGPVVCRPDYEVNQPQKFDTAEGMLFDPATNTMLYLARHGVLLAIRFDGKTFSIGNAVDLGSRLLLGGDVDTHVAHQLGVVDQGKVWLPGLQHKPGTVAAPYDHWLYAVNLSDLFAPAPHVLPVTPGRTVTIQAERTVDNSTRVIPGTAGLQHVVAKVTAGGCSDFPAGVACAADNVAGNGFQVGHDSIFGYIGDPIAYQIRVPESGTYRLSLHASTYPNISTSAVEITVAGQSARIPVPPGWNYHHLSATTMFTLPAGVHTVLVGHRPGEHGWFLNSLTFQRI